MERFTIRVTEKGLAIEIPGRPVLELTAVEALMFLDILKNEEKTLVKMAEKASPLPFRIQVRQEE